jgi:RNA polymerase sigma factor (sigma-70 family)
MTNCRSIEPSAWEHARQALTFYFSRRHGFDHAEDLAQETLTRLWSRADFQFEKEEDFLKVCYGFAQKVSYRARRHAGRHTAESLDYLATEPADPGPGPEAAESKIHLQQILKIGRTQLQEEEWQLLRDSVRFDRSTIARRLNLGNANRVRVKLYRARKKLAMLTGWSNE